MKRYAIALAIVAIIAMVALVGYAATGHGQHKAKNGASPAMQGETHASGCPMMKTGSSASCPMNKSGSCGMSGGAGGTCPMTGAASHHGMVTGAAASKGGKVVSAICPVLRNKIPDVRKAAGHSVYKGKTYYFCRAWCKPQFDKNPQKYLSRKH